MRTPIPQATEKHALRTRIRRRLAALAQQTLDAIGLCVSRRIMVLPAVCQAPVLAGYAAMAEEVNINEVVEDKLRQGGKVVLPRYDAVARCYRMVAIADFEVDLVCGAYGIREPRPELPCEDPARLRAADTVWLVPGLAFDSQGNRLGRGGGYYDRLLAGVLGPRIGVAQDWQILPRVPAQAHDVTMTVVVSEKRTLQSPQVHLAPQTRKETPCPQISSTHSPSPQGLSNKPSNRFH